MIAVVLGTAAVVTVVVVVGLLIDRKLPLLPRAEPTEPRTGPGRAASTPARATTAIPGETAATAVGVPAAWRDRVAAGRCGCGQALAVQSDEALRFAGRPLVVVRLACAACGHARSVYLEPAAG